MGYGVNESYKTGVYQNETGVWVFSCQQRFCFMHRAEKSEAAALKNEAEHTCPYSGGTTTLSWSIQVQILNKIWKELDDKLDELIELKSKPEYSGVELARLQGECRGMALVLTHFMSPFYTSPEEIAKEASSRRKSRLAGREHMTAGLHLRYMSGTSERDAYEARRAAGLPPEPLRQPTPWVQAVAEKLDPDKIATIKAAGQMFSAIEIARIQSLDVKVVEFILKS